MAIVARNNITVSNVNDGTITHTAYSYSVDGTDRFTTVYPNLNLLSGTSYKTQINDNHYMTMPVPKTGGYLGNNYISANYINGTPGNVTDWARFYIRQQAVPDFQYIQANTTYTVSLWARGSGTSSIYVWSSVGAVSNPATANKTINLTNVWKLFTLTFNSASSIPDNSQIFIRTPAGSNIDICLPKLEQGSTATPWMPSSSEVTTSDYPSYIGQYSDLSSTSSTDPAKYAPWTIFKGNDGVGIKTTDVTYAISTSGTTAPSTDWTSSVPSLVKGQYLWTKTVWTYTDNSSKTGYSVTYISNDGTDGDDGLPGKDGTGIQTTTITYAGSTSGTTAPSTGWTSEVTTVPAGSYLWTKTVWAYTDNTSETGYSVAKMGKDGATGIPGQAGADGKTSYLHIAYATNSTGTDGFDVSNATGKTYIGQYTDFMSTDSTDPSKYTWSLIKGDKGDPGAPGTNGTDGTSGIIVSSVAPDSPQTGQLWQDTSTTPQLVKKWTGSEWVIWEFYAENIKAITLETLSAIIGKLKNTYTVDYGAGVHTGTVTIENGMKIVDDVGISRTTTDFTSQSSGQGMFAQYLPDKSNSDKYQQAWYTPFSLRFDDTVNDLHGQITAENVTLVPWTNITYLSGYTTAENNPCQYRKIKNLDGSYTVQFRGQVKPVSGSFPGTNSESNFQIIANIPVDIRPIRHTFLSAVGDMMGTQTIRIGALSDGRIQVGVRGTASSYIGINSLIYTI